MNQIVILFLILALAVGFPIFFKLSESFKQMEGYSNYTLGGASGNVPVAQTEVLVQDTYPAIGKNQISNDGANNIWQYYPVVEVGSYEQVTNNRIPNNPDEGTCMPASMCGALYHDSRNAVEHYNPSSRKGTRVGYFDTNANLLL